VNERKVVEETSSDHGSTTCRRTMAESSETKLEEVEKVNGSCWSASRLTDSISVVVCVAEARTIIKC